MKTRKQIGGLVKNPEKYLNRLLIATPSTGLFRAEWVHARHSQIIPTNWSAQTVTQFMNSLIPVEYSVADAYNLIVKSALESKVEWLLTIEQDNVLPLDAFIRINEYMRKGDIPVVSALYFTKSVPPEPILYRGNGNGYFSDWKLGDKVWVTGIPQGFTLYHMSVMKAMWNESPEYVVSGTTTRRIFETPNRILIDPETGGMVSETGTQDLAWCKRVIKEGFLEKSGWKDFVKKHPDNQFLVDTSLLVKHITIEGQQFPLSMPPEFIPEKDYKPQERL